MNQYGVLGEQAVVPERALAEYPEDLSYAQAAAVWMQYLTAYGALVYLGKVGAGDFVVLPAASSSVGLAAIQIVKAEGGISIAATRTSEKRAELIALGADHVIATQEEDFVARVKEITGGKGARLIFDPVAGEFVDKLATAAAPMGTIFIYGGLSMQPTPFPMMQAIGKSLTIRGYTLMDLHKYPDAIGAAKKYVFAGLKAGRLMPKIAKEFPLSEVKAAYEYLESNAQVGKIVVLA
jgi:NADPH:quinone reductase-like Zn-dependent oxidoreductase